MSEEVKTQSTEEIKFTIPEDTTFKINDDQIKFITDKQNDLSKKFDLLLKQDKENDDLLVNEQKTLNENIKLILEKNDSENENQEEIELLRTLVEQTKPIEQKKEYDTAVFYGNLSIILLVMIVLPMYVTYRILKSVFSLTRFIV